MVCAGGAGFMAAAHRGSRLPNNGLKLPIEPTATERGAYMIFRKRCEALGCTTEIIKRDLSQQMQNSD